MPAEAGDGNVSDGSAAFDQIVSHDYSASSGSPLSFMTSDGQSLRPASIGHLTYTLSVADVHWTSLEDTVKLLYLKCSSRGKLKFHTRKELL